jgi:rhodanese-related sulfurtransferase
MGSAVVPLDVRPYSEYVVGHLKGAISVRLSSLFMRRLAQGKVSTRIVANTEREREREREGNRFRPFFFVFVLLRFSSFFWRNT